MAEKERGVQVAGVIGYPVGHSVSPAMQQAACDHYRLPLLYMAWDTPPPSLDNRVQGLRRGHILGANVTVPHKQSVLPLLDEVEPEAAFVGAVNTIVNRAGRLSGYNTDVPGFLRALREDASFSPLGRAALLLGAGGAARGVGYALLRAGVRSLFIANRHPARAQALARSLSDLGGGVEAVEWEDEVLAHVAAGCDLVVNTTTLGMRGGPGEGLLPLPATALHSGLLVFDLVYNPSETPLARAARAAGGRAITGLPMLVYQGAEAFTLWTGLPAPVAIMRAAAAEALAGRGAA